MSIIELDKRQILLNLEKKKSIIVNSDYMSVYSENCLDGVAIKIGYG